MHGHTQGMEEVVNWEEEQEEEKGKEKRIADSLSISGVYLKRVLQVAIETHK